MFQLANPSHQVALDLARAVVTATETLPPLLIYGPVGVGKTHLLQLVQEECTAAKRETRVRYSTVNAYLEDLLEHLREKSMAEFKEAWTGIELLLLDQIEDVRGREQTQDFMLAHLEQLQGTGTRVIMTCSLSMVTQGEFTARFQGRFPRGSTVAISVTGWEMAKRVLSFDGELALSAEVAQSVVALCGSSDLRRLKGAVMRVRAWCSINELPLSSENVNRALAEVYL